MDAVQEVFINQTICARPDSNSKDTKIKAPINHEYDDGTGLPNGVFYCVIS
ncbi:hypothetical protein MBRA1_000867b [Malassezia brasiliensis]|uniref:Uncharacterized protein n=1 Tax=Malassezia brasiliensis TaxID=1821822 RepID=A0AAF0DUM2_9BASI|nr:hypothetical protein MBRA1_000867b [Malassezia brasiliensis]